MGPFRSGFFKTNISYSNMGKTFRILAETAVITAFFIIQGCSPRIIPPAQRDTVVQVRTETIERLRTDTVYIRRPMDSLAVVTKDTSSRLVTQLAISEASVMQGLLRHSLWTNPKALIDTVEVMLHDTLIIRDSVFASSSQEPVIIPAELSKWQRFTQALGYIFIGVCLLAIGYLIVRIFSKFR